jgi:hypothetical protein
VAASVGVAAAPHLPNPAYDRPEVGASTAGVAALDVATNPNPNDIPAGQQTGGGSNGGVGPTSWKLFAGLNTI